jgi:hypothetical protein
VPERLSPRRTGKQECSLFSVIGEKTEGHTIALIIAAAEADAESYALHELGFVTVSMTSLVSDCVYVGRADLKR